MNLEAHYTDGRRWSHISNAWILLSSWNDREELATMTAAAESVRQENVRLRAEIERLQARLTESEQAAYDVAGTIESLKAENMRIYDDLYLSIGTVRQLQAQLATAKNDGIAEGLERAAVMYESSGDAEGLSEDFRQEAVQVKEGKP